MPTNEWTRSVTELARAAALPGPVIARLVEISSLDLRERGGAKLAAQLAPGTGAEFLAAHRYASEHPGLHDRDGLQPHEVWTRHHLPDGAALLEEIGSEILREIAAGPYQYLTRHDSNRPRARAVRPPPRRSGPAIRHRDIGKGNPDKGKGNHATNPESGETP